MYISQDFEFCILNIVILASGLTVEVVDDNQ